MISLDLSSTLICPSTRPLALPQALTMLPQALTMLPQALTMLPQALTMWIAALPVALSKERRRVLPSRAMTSLSERSEMRFIQG